jgi:uncharacterized membrane protein YqjE
MEPIPGSFRKLAATSKAVAQLLLAIGENRLELLTVEIQEELQRVIQMLLLVIGLAACGLLAGITLTASIVFLLSPYSPAIILLSLTALYAGIGGFLYWRLTRLLRDWEFLSATLDQIRKDRECHEDITS